MSAPRSFKLAVKANTVEKDAEYPPVPYEFEEADGSVRVVTAHYPGDGSLTILLAATGEDVAENEIVGSIFSFFQDTFSSDDNRYIRSKVRTGEIPAEMLVAIVQDMIEGWTSFPTPPRPGSTGSQRSTGTRSTGRARDRVSTPQTSLPAGSAP